VTPRVPPPGFLSVQRIGARFDKSLDQILELGATLACGFYLPPRFDRCPRFSSSSSGGLLRTSPLHWPPFLGLLFFVSFARLESFFPFPGDNPPFLAPFLHYLHGDVPFHVPPRCISLLAPFGPRIFSVRTFFFRTFSRVVSIRCISHPSCYRARPSRTFFGGNFFSSFFS